jgi:flagellar hook-length control protein FliK
MLSYNEATGSPDDGGIMIAAVNELSGPVAPALRWSSAPTEASGGFEAALARSIAPLRAGETCAKAPAWFSGTAPSSAPLASHATTAAVPTLQDPAPGPAPVESPALALPTAPAAAANASRLADPLRSAAIDAAPVPPSPMQFDDPAAVPPPEISSTAPAKAAPRKTGASPETKRPDPADSVVESAPSGGAAQLLALPHPPLPPLGAPPARRIDEDDATAAKDASAPLQPAPAGAPATPDTAQPASDFAPPPGGDFRALLANAPPSLAPPRGKSSVALQSDPASAPVAHGDALGLQIVRHIAAGKDALSVALTPESLGRVEVHLHFDDAGTLRAVVSASTPEALALLHRDSAALDQALAAAGVRTDAQSFQFDSRAGDRGDRTPEPRAPGERTLSDLTQSAEAAVIQPLRSSGTLDLLA